MKKLGYFQDIGKKTPKNMVFIFPTIKLTFYFCVSSWLPPRVFTPQRGRPTLVIVLATTSAGRVGLNLSMQQVWPKFTRLRIVCKELWCIQQFKIKKTIQIWIFWKVIPLFIRIWVWRNNLCVNSSVRGQIQQWSNCHCFFCFFQSFLLSTTFLGTYFRFLHKCFQICIWFFSFRMCKWMKICFQ